MPDPIHPDPADVADGYAQLLLDTTAFLGEAHNLLENDTVLAQVPVGSFENYADKLVDNLLCRR